MIQQSKTELGRSLGMYDIYETRTERTESFAGSILGNHLEITFREDEVEIRDCILLPPIDEIENRDKDYIINSVDIYKYEDKKNRYPLKQEYSIHSRIINIEQKEWSTERNVLRTPS